MSLNTTRKNDSLENNLFSSVIKTRFQKRYTQFFLFLFLFKYRKNDYIFTYFNNYSDGGQLEDKSTHDSHGTGKIIVISAASGAGKSTLLEYIRKEIPDLVYSISATTRPPRAGEQEGVHYFFMSVEEFKQKITRNEFAEWEFVHGNYYGTPKAFIDTTIHSGRHIIMDIDVYGKFKFDRVYPEAVGIFIMPPTLAVLERRLRNRKTDSEETIALRLENAAKEIDLAREKGKYEYTIKNDKLSRAEHEFAAIVKEIINGNP